MTRLLCVAVIIVTTALLAGWAAMPASRGGQPAGKLQLVAAASPPARQGRDNSGVEVRWLGFSPDGQNLAVLMAPSAPAQAGTLYLLSVTYPAAPPVLVGPCESRSAAWLARPAALVFGALKGGTARLVTHGLTDGGREIISHDFAASELGAVSAKGQLAAVVARQPGGRRALILWNWRSDELAARSVPAGFAPSLAVPPVIGETLIALVHDNRGSFAGFDIASATWLDPVPRKPLANEVEPTWTWSTAGAAWPWVTGGGNQNDWFLVDEKALALWDVVTSQPHGPEMQRGRALVMPVWNELIPLDLERGRGAMAASSFAVVQAAIVSMSAASDLSQVIVSYQGGDCGLVRRGRPQQSLITDGSVFSEAIALSPDGRRAALVREAYRIDVVETGSGSTIARWRLPGLQAEPLAKPR